MYSISFEVLPNFFSKRCVYTVEMTYPKIDLSALQSVLKTIVLFDSMGIAVQKSEIEHFLLESTASIEGIEISLSLLEDLDIIKVESSRYSLFARDSRQLENAKDLKPFGDFPKFILKSLASFSFVRGIYELNLPGMDKALLLDVSGLNNPNLAMRYCNVASRLIGTRVLFVSRYAKIENELIFHSLALAGMTSVYNPLGLEKLTKRHSDCIAKFPNRVVDSGTHLKPLFNSPKKNTQKPVFNASGRNNAELFTWITAHVEGKDIPYIWEKNQSVYQQWLLPKLSKLNRKYQLV